MDLSNLTLVQQGLVTDLIKEFTKINPKKTDNGSKRFSFETINDCIKEEERFKATITKHNLTMMKVFVNQFEEEIKGFKDEFGSVLNVQLGYYRTSTEKTGSLEKLINFTKENSLSGSEYNEIVIFFVSKKKEYSSNDSRYDYCGGFDYQKIYADFKRERVIHKLESGKEVIVYKIVGLQYRIREYLHKDKGYIASTLDELIQYEKSIQQRIVYLAS